MAGSSSLAQERVRHAAARGVEADLTQLPAEFRVIEASVLAELLLERAVSSGATHPSGLQIKGAVVAGTLDLRNCTCAVAFTLRACRIANAPELAGATLPMLALEDCDFPGMEADGLYIEHDLSLKRSRVSRKIALGRARIGGALDCSGAEIENEGGQALRAEFAEMGSMLFRAFDYPGNKEVPLPCKVTGQLYLPGIRIKGILNFVGASLINKGRQALTIEGAEISGGVYMRALDTFGDKPVVPCFVNGEVALYGALIRGELDFSGATLTNEGGRAAIMAYNAHIGGDVLLSRLARRNGREAVLCNVRGAVVFTGTHIGGQLNLVGAKLSGLVDLTRCRSSSLADDVAVNGGDLQLGCWTDAKPLYLDGFAYDRLSRDTTWDHDARFAWLRGTNEYSPAPWEQLRMVYTGGGMEDDARLTAIARQEDRLKRGHLRRYQRVWRWILGVTIGHGYRPGLAAVWALAAIALFTTLIWFNRGDLVYVGKGAEATVTVWTALSYAADTVIPVADFNVAGDWSVRGWIEAVRFLFVALGWLIVSLFVAGFTRIVRS
jgi:hypothetical protein